jgi:hypothetical protein
MRTIFLILFLLHCIFHCYAGGYGDLSADFSTIGLWRFEESGSTIDDESTTANDATLYNTSSTTAFFGNGKVYDGTSAYGEAPYNSAYYDVLAVEVVCQADWETSPPDNSAYLVGVYNAWRLKFETSADGDVCFTIHLTGGERKVCTTTAMNDYEGEWVYIAAGFARPYLGIYLNGNLDNWAYYDEAISFTGTTVLKIGGFDQYTFRFHGILDTIRLSTATRSAVEIRQTYQYMKGGYGLIN